MNTNTPSPQVIPLKPQQQKPASQLLARSFFNYPAIRHIMPDEKERQRALPWYFSMAVRIALRYGIVLTTPKMEGVATWIAPENTDFSPWDYLRAGLWQLPLRLKPGNAWRMLENDLYVENMRKQSAPEKRYWYLWVLGVEPGLQRSGVGRALIEPGLEKADQGGFACFLETHNIANLDYYRHYGFEVIHAGRVPRPDLPVWAMLRPQKRAP